MCKRYIPPMSVLMKLVSGIRGPVVGTLEIVLMSNLLCVIEGKNGLVTIEGGIGGLKDSDNPEKFKGFENREGSGNTEGTFKGFNDPEGTMNPEDPEGLNETKGLKSSGDPDDGEDSENCEVLEGPENCKGPEDWLENSKTWLPVAIWIFYVII